MNAELTRTVGCIRGLPSELPAWSALTNLILAPNPCDDCCVLHFTVVAKSDGITNRNL
jgi:hypothetical protein